jgi:hypothetical protein
LEALESPVVMNTSNRTTTSIGAKMEIFNPIYTHHPILWLALEGHL